MDPIRSTPFHGLPPTPPAGLGKSHGQFPAPVGPGEVGASAPVESGRAPEEVGAVERRVIGFIEEARSNGLEGDALVTKVVQRELDVQLGPAATPEMREAVASFFRADPILMSMFNRIAT